jgi:hypothetical protein
MPEISPLGETPVSPRWAFGSTAAQARGGCSGRAWPGRAHESFNRFVMRSPEMGQRKHPLRLAAYALECIRTHSSDRSVCAKTLFKICPIKVLIFVSMTGDLYHREWAMLTPKGVLSGRARPTVEPQNGRGQARPAWWLAAFRSCESPRTIRALPCHIGSCRAAETISPAKLDDIGQVWNRMVRSGRNTTLTGYIPIQTHPRGLVPTRRTVGGQFSRGNEARIASRPRRLAILAL